jgi:hypothetical protein
MTAVCGMRTCEGAKVRGCDSARARGRKGFFGYELTVDVSHGSMPDGIHSGFMKVRRRSPPYELEIAIGDPDSDESIRFQPARP